METDKNTKYIQFPLRLMRNFFNDHKGTINNIFDSGIYYYSMRLTADRSEAATHALYDCCRHKDNLTTYLKKELTRFYKNGQLVYDEDQNGFSSSAAFIPCEIDNFIEILNNNSELNQAIIEYYQVHKAMRSKNLGITGNTGQILTDGKAIVDGIPDGEPWPMVNKDLLFDYYKNDKDQWQLVQFAGYIAIGSIIGKRHYCRTNKQHIMARMFGYASHKAIPENLNPLVKELMNKYSTRYWMDKLLQQLELTWQIKTYSRNMRGVMIGKEKATLETMALAAEKGKRVIQVNDLKVKKNEAWEKALQQLNKKKDHPNEGNKLFKLLSVELN
ncbi:MAG: hypothetical protein ACOYNC_07215 [Bacteroidales bacterium]